MRNVADTFEFNERKNIVYEKIRVFGKQIILLLLIAFIVFTQFVEINGNINVIFTASFWLNVLVNWAILSIIYSVYLSDGIEEGLINQSYIAARDEFAGLYKRVIDEKHIKDIENYAVIRNEEIRRQALTDLLVGSGISLKEFCAKYERLNNDELKQCEELSDHQIKILRKIKNSKIKIKKISLNELAINNNRKSKFIYDESFGYNEGKIITRLILIRFIKAAIWACVLSSFILDAKDTINIMPLLTWIVMKLSSIYWAITSGKNDGRRIILNDKRVSFLKKIMFMQHFFDWFENGAKPLEALY